VAGLLPHGSGHVPVIDLSMLALGHPAPARVSTRLVLVHCRHAQALPVLLGLAGADTRKVQRMIGRTADWPVDGYLISSPFYVRP
ncbi:hypothetical protein, partial [Escherichia coli]|uniref:hypothetical protein n=1 Tax=Escherichia coli TaxID=562 RepID=UPI0039E15FEB